MRILLDTNVMIDLFSQRDPFWREASRLLVMQALGDAELWVSAKSFTDVFYVLSKHFASSAIQAAFEESVEWLSVCSVDGADIVVASQKRWQDFEDCLVSICAEKVKADYLITRDGSGFSASNIPAFTPEAFFTMLEEDLGVTYDMIDL